MSNKIIIFSQKKHKKVNNMKKFSLSSLALLISGALLSNIEAQASVVRADVDYQVFRNFAENKGQFQVGAVNVPVYDNKGNYLGTALPQNVPMPDFSSVDSKRYLSGLIAPQYIVSVEHNSDTHFKNLTFGQARSGSNVTQFKYSAVDRNDHDTLDYNTPRLNKMVTEVTPADLPATLTVSDLFSGRYTAFARVGSGTQAIQDGNNVTIISNAYNYPTGGTALKMSSNVGDMVGTVVGDVADANTSYSPLVSYGAKGDSGSPLFAYDSVTKKWVLIGSIVQYYGYDYIRNNYMISQLNFLKQKQNEDLASIINIKSTKPITWSNSSKAGQSVITSELNDVTVRTLKGSDLNNGQDIILSGNDFTMVLNDNINQGAGGIYFNNSGTVKGKTDSTTHVGSGLYVTGNNVVNWQVKNPASDRISKLGTGTLIVNGTGKNFGSMSVGDGKVILAQNADSNGNSEAFSVVTLASGRGTVVLKDDKQIANSANIKFDSHGGTLDLNGTNITFDAISHVDDGANITSNGDRSTITLNPTSDRTFLGNFKGNTDVVVNGTGKSYTLTGNQAISGNFTISNNSNLTFEGAPVVYADVYGSSNPTVIVDADYNNRTISANQYIVNGALNIGRNISSMTGDLIANNGAKVQLGANSTLASTSLSTVPSTAYQGNITLNGNANLTIGKASLNTTVNAQNNTTLNMQKDALITLTGNSTMGHLNMDKGATINLNPNGEFNKFNTLTVNGNLAGQGTFRFSMDLAALAANKLNLNGNVSGNHTITLLDSGREPTQTTNKINIINVAKANQKYSFTLANDVVNAGAYRYSFANGTLTADKVSKIVEIIDPNYVAPNFDNLDSWFSSEIVQNTVKNILKTTTTKVLTYDEIVAGFEKSGLISTELNADEKLVNPLTEGKVYDTINLTKQDRIEMDANGQKDADLNPADYTDTTPTPESKGEVTLYDTEGAIADGLQVVDGKIVYNTSNTTIDSNNSTSNETNAINEVHATTTQDMLESGSQLTISGEKQKEQMSKYSNAIVSLETTKLDLAHQSQQALNDKIITIKGNDIWVTYQHQQTKSDNDLYRQDKNTQNLVQLGASLGLTDKDTLILSMSENKQDTDFEDSIDANQRVREVDLAYKHQFENGIFMGGQVGVGKIKSDVETDGKNVKTSQSLVKGGVFAGIDLAWQDTIVTPYATITHYNIKGKDLTVSDATINLPKHQDTIVDVGVESKHNFRFNNATLQPMIAVSYHTGANKEMVKVNNAEFASQYKQGFKALAGAKVSAGPVQFSMKGGVEKNRGYKTNTLLQSSLEVTF